MDSRLFLVPLTAFALACSDANGTGPNPYQGGNGGPTVVSGDTNVGTVGAFVVKSVAVDGVTYGYQVFVPANYNSVKKVPVVVFMHGGGEAGSDNDRQTRVGLGEFVRAQMSTFPAVVVFPQSPSGESNWRFNIKITPAALDQTMKQYGRADSTRIYLTGWSAGGGNGFTVAFNKVANNQPNRFAAFAPIAATICASCLTSNPNLPVADATQMVKQSLQSVQIWQFQGSQDKTITPAFIAPQVAILKTGANYKYTEYPNGDHQLTGLVYSQPAFWDWLWAQHR